MQTPPKPVILVHLTALLLLAGSLAGCGPSKEDIQRRVAQMPVEVMIATLDGSAGDQLRVARLRVVIDQLSTNFAVTSMQIADMTVAARNSLRENGIEESLVDIMESMLRVAPFRRAGNGYAEYLAGYVVARTAGTSREEAVAGLRVVGSIRDLAGR